MMKVRRFLNNPIISPDMDQKIGDNINGPSLIRVPEWIKNPLGKYYLYFASHAGSYIRLAYADRLEGPWKIYEPGALKLEDSLCLGHLASPDVHVNYEREEIWMYYHGVAPKNDDLKSSFLAQNFPILGRQRSRVALSKDGLHFSNPSSVLGPSYMRLFLWNNYWYALGMPGIFLRSENGLTDFEIGPTLFTINMRHLAVKLQDNILNVFYSNVGDCPERILLSKVELTSDWAKWKASEPKTILEPEMKYEGVSLPLMPSKRGIALEKVRQLRDPAIFQEDGKTYLLYSVAGEKGLAIAELIEVP